MANIIFSVLSDTFKIERGVFVDELILESCYRYNTADAENIIPILTVYDDKIYLMKRLIKLKEKEPKLLYNETFIKIEEKITSTLNNEEKIIIQIIHYNEQQSSANILKLVKLFTHNFSLRKITEFGELTNSQINGLVIIILNLLEYCELGTNNIYNFSDISNEDKTTINKKSGKIISAIVLLIKNNVITFEVPFKSRLFLNVIFADVNNFNSIFSCIIKNFQSLKHFVKYIVLNKEFINSVKVKILVDLLTQLLNESNIDKKHIANSEDKYYFDFFISVLFCIKYENIKQISNPILFFKRLNNSLYNLITSINNININSNININNINNNKINNINININNIGENVINKEQENIEHEANNIEYEINNIIRNVFPIYNHNFNETFYQYYTEYLLPENLIKDNGMYPIITYKHFYSTILEKIEENNEVELEIISIIKSNSYLRLKLVDYMDKLLISKTKSEDKMVLVKRMTNIISIIYTQILKDHKVQNLLCNYEYYISNDNAIDCFPVNYCSEIIKGIKEDLIEVKLIRIQTKNFLFDCIKFLIQTRWVLAGMEFLLKIDVISNNYELVNSLIIYLCESQSDETLIIVNVNLSLMNIVNNNLLYYFKKNKVNVNNLTDKINGMIIDSKLESSVNKFIKYVNET